MRIKKKKYCCGCYACKQICPQKCIEFKHDKEGFLYPKIDKTVCINCGLCEKVCPVKHSDTLQVKPLKAYSVKAKSHDVLMKSSSGGTFYGIAKHVLQNKGFVYGAAETESGIEHICIDNESMIEKLMGSKYIQSHIGDVFPEIKEKLKSDKMVLFSGTPCQVYGLKCFLRKDYKKLITIDFICHGVPSMQIWESYKAYLSGLYGTDIHNINFRDKRKGWKQYGLSYNVGCNSMFESNNDSMYLLAFKQNYTLRPSCYDCKFKNLHRASDITLADFWSVNAFLQNIDFYNGVSLVIANTYEGNTLLSKLNGYDITDLPLREVLLSNVSYNLSAEAPFFRKLFIWVVKNLGWKSANIFLKEKSSISRRFEKLRFRIQLNQVKKMYKDIR